MAYIDITYNHDASWDTLSLRPIRTDVGKDTFDGNIGLALHEGIERCLSLSVHDIFSLCAHKQKCGRKCADEGCEKHDVVVDEGKGWL
jgi:hypothetical protein